MDDVKKTEGFRARLQEAVRKSLNAASADDERFAGIRDRLKELDSELIKVRGLVAEVTQLRDRLLKDQEPRERISLTPFYFFMLMFFLATIVGGIFAAKEVPSSLSSYFSYVLPIYAALVAGAVLFVQRNPIEDPSGPDDHVIKRDVLLYKSSAVLLSLGFGAFIASGSSGVQFLFAMIYPPGVVCSYFFLGLRSRKWEERGPQSRTWKDYLLMVFAIILFALSLITFALWTMMLWDSDLSSMSIR